MERAGELKRRGGWRSPPTQSGESDLISIVQGDEKSGDGDSRKRQTARELEDE